MDNLVPSRPSRRRTADGDSGHLQFGGPVPEITWTEPHGARSSVMYELHESKRRKQLLMLHGHRQRIWAFNQKRAGYRLASSLGVAVPEMYVESTSIQEIDWAALRERFAIKPHGGAANRGVFLLVRAGRHVFVDLMDNGEKSIDQIVERYEGFTSSAAFRLASPSSSSSPRVRNWPPWSTFPMTLKVYCFYDEPAVVMQRRTSGTADASQWKFKIWTSGWDDVGPVKFADRYDSMLERPGGGDDVLDVARLIGRHLAVPFVQIDLFDTPNGPVFGEISPHPGPPERWEPGADEELGVERRGELAEARLLAEGILPSEPRPTSGP